MVSGPAGLEGRRGERAEFGGDGEDAVEFALGRRGDYFGGDLDVDSERDVLDLVRGVAVVSSYLVLPRDRVAEPSWAPNVRSIARNWSMERPSSRRFEAVKASRMKVFSTLDMSARRGILMV